MINVGIAACTMDVEIKTIAIKKVSIIQKDFEAFEIVRTTGVTNMFDVKAVQILSGLSYDKIEAIMKDYDRLKKLYN